MITPKAGPFVNCGKGFFATADFIYWHVSEDNLEFAILADATGGGQKGKVFAPDFHFEPGFKVGLGYMTSCDGWDVYARYTWLRTHDTHRSVIAKGDLSIEDILWVTNANFGERFRLIINKESFNWRHDFNVIDLELGRNFYVSPCLKLRPMTGFKGTWQKQHAKAIAEETNEETLQNFISIGNHKNDFWGFGIRIGLDITWQFLKHWSIYGGSAFSALWGEFDTQAKNVQKDALTGAVTSIFINNEYVFHTIRPVFEWNIALRYENGLYCDRYHFTIQAGWEEQVWMEQNQFSNFTFNNILNRGDLILHGLTVKVRFDF
ncbi:MAG: hypothetical protein Tsb0015_04030 [Simkaniaceae bacterium]